MFEAFYPFDLAVVKTAVSLREHAGVFFTPVFQVITKMGDAGIAFLVAVAVMMLFRSTRKAGFTAMLAVAIGAVFTNLVLKLAIARPRPFADETSVFYEFWQAAGSMTEKESSFPSGHATASMAFAFAMFLACKKKTSWLFLLIPLLMGYTRIYFVVHFASDVLGGYLVGIVSGTLAFFAVKLLGKWKLFEKFLQADGVLEWIRKARAKKKASAEPAPAEPTDAEGENLQEESDDSTDEI